MNETEQFEADLAVLKGVISNQEDMLELAEQHAEPDALGRDGLDPERETIASLNRLVEHLERASV